MSRKKAKNAIVGGGGVAKPDFRPSSSLQAALLGALVLCATISVVRNRFITLDDGLYLGNASVVHGLTARGVTFAFTSVSALYWHPLTWLSHELDVELFGMDPAGHHLISLVFHAIAAALLFLLLKRLGVDRWYAAAGALLWALHPLRVESFAWTAERKDVLCVAFFLAAVLAYLHYIGRPSPARFALWTGLGILALMSKPTAVSLVPILLLLDRWPLRRANGAAQLLKEKLPVLAVTAAVAFLTVYGQKRSGSMSYLAGVPLSIRLENVPISYMRYIGKILWPVNLSCFYAYDKHPTATLVTACALAFCAATALTVWQRNRRPWLLAGWLWFVIALLPNIGLLQAGRQSIADRFTGLSAIGVSIAAMFAISGWAGSSRFRRMAAGASICGVLTILGALTWRQIGFWRDSVQLYEHAISVEDSDYIRAVLADTLLAQHRYQEAEPHLLAAVHLAPEHADYHNNLANVLIHSGRIEQAFDQATIARRLAPNDISAALTMGRILFLRNDYWGALRQLDRAVQLGAEKSLVASALNDMGASVASRGHPREAEPLLRKAVEFNPSLVQARRNLAIALEDQGAGTNAPRQ